MPSEETLKIGEDENGQRYAIIVTPKVQAVVRNQFDCQELEGAQLENQPTGSQSCTGDHWEERLFYPEALSGVISPTTNVLSPLTLALMEDSGWYSANYSKSSVSPWGHGVGCEFIKNRCIAYNETEREVYIPERSRGYFCAKPNSRGCSPAHTHKMACTMIDYSLYYPPTPPPDKFQYFPNKPSVGGPRQVDYCPVYGSTYSGLAAEQLDCSNQDNVDSFNLFGEYYGPNSMCFESNTGSGRCYQAQCILSPPSVKIQVGDDWKTCEYDFQKIPLPRTNLANIVEKLGVEGYVTCPRLSAACPNIFCPANCAGRGVCTFNDMKLMKNIENVTGGGVCNCFNTSDTSPGCTDSISLDGKYLNGPGFLSPKFNRGFFDPLVAVFVDHPDTWTTTTWSWAAGLFVIFLYMILCTCSSFWPSSPKKRIRNLPPPRRSRKQMQKKRRAPSQQRRDRPSQQRGDRPSQQRSRSVPSQHRRTRGTPQRSSSQGRPSKGERAQRGDPQRSRSAGSGNVIHGQQQYKQKRTKSGHKSIF